MATRFPGLPKGKIRQIFLALAILMGLSGVVFHRPILRAVGDHLIVEDEAQRVDAMFVLSGNSLDRGKEAAKLYHEGWAPRVVCLGGEKSPGLQLYGIEDLTFEPTRRVLLEHGVPPSAIDSLPKGTSTYEEFVAIQEYCKARGMDKIMVVSSRYHTRRIDAFFRLRLHFEGIEMVLRGAYDGDIDEAEWWRSESGLIFVNNEYIKYFYYWLHY